MKLENQVCSLELAQKLKSLGVKQESLFCWQYFEPTPAKYHDPEYRLKFCEHKPDKETYWEHVSAFTCSELGDMLPMEYMSIKYGGDRWFGVKQGALWEFEMIKYPDPIVSNLEADCRAKILIYLLENKLINNLSQ